MIYLYLLFIPFLLLSESYALEEQKKLHYHSISQKKERFFKLVVPAVLEVDKELRDLYKVTKKKIEKKENISSLMQQYKATSALDLLKRIKPHPPSITIAQAALESAWGTSRFFKEANNIFGVWTRSKDPRYAIKAGIRRKNGKQVYLRKYKNLEASIRAYYKNIARNKAYKKFRDVRYKTSNPYVLIHYLDKYSELKEKYPILLKKIIKYNNLTQYDSINDNL